MELVRSIRGVIIGRWGGIEQPAGAYEASLASGAGEQAVVPDTMEATRQDMKQEAADELIGRERHDLLPVGAVTTIVLT